MVTSPVDGRPPAQAHEWLPKTIAFLAGHGLPATPHNYAVGYVYVSGENTAIQHDVRASLDRAGKLTEGAVATLFKRHFANDNDAEAVNELASGVILELEGVIEALKSSGDDTEKYAKALDDLAGHLQSHPSMQKMASLIGAVAGQTRKLAVQNRSLSDRLQESSGKLGTMQSQLQEVRRESMTDPLTGIANRRAFESELKLQTTMAAKTGKPLSLVMCDIDHFKTFNDTYGHQMGDMVLKLVAKVLYDNIRASDRAARYGGEEFAILLPNAGLDTGVSSADVLRRMISQKKLKNRNPNETLGNLTLSSGGSEFEPGEDIGAFVKRADEALYRAKAAGRNKVYSNAKD